MREYFFHDQVRLDWGFGNPNVTGSLIALIMLAVWTLTYLPRWWGRIGFWLALGSNTVLGVFLLQTFSRGAVVSLLAGAAVLAWFAPRPWRARWIIPLALLVGGLVCYAVNLGFTARTIHGLSGEDRSVTNRWLIYKMVPRMIWDAPEGWGHGRSGEAFRQWYQPIGHMEEYDHLINSHATWLVEWPWYGRLGYLVGWGTILTLVAPSRRRYAEEPSVPESTAEASAQGPQRHVAGPRYSSGFIATWFSVALATWVAFAVGATFTAIAHEWVIWIAPGTSLLLVLIARLWLGAWPSFAAWKAAGITMSCVCVAFAVCAMAIPPMANLRDGIVEVGGANSTETRVLLSIDETVLGQFYGQRIREQCAAKPIRFLIRWRPNASLSTSGATVICAGNSVTLLTPDDEFSIRNASRVIFINPDAPPRWMAKALESPRDIRCIIGSFSGGPYRFVWESIAGKNKMFKTEVQDGAGRFLKDWIQLL